MVMKRETGRGLIINNGRVILMERWRDGQHYFSIPGGGIEGNETPEQAARREILEEFGLDVDVGQKVYEMSTSDIRHHIFLCQYKGGEPVLQAGSPEAVAQAQGDNRYLPRWIDIEDIATIPLMYWEPLREHLLTDIENGFGVETKTITVN